MEYAKGHGHIFSDKQVDGQIQDYLEIRQASLRFSH